MKHFTSRLLSVFTLVATLAFPVAFGADGDKPTPPPGGGPGGGGKRGDAGRPQRDAWLKEVGASEEQAAKIREILKDQMDQQRALRQNTDLTPEQRRAKMGEVRTATTAKIKAVLTPDQFAKYEKLQEERRGRGPGGPGAPGGPGGGKQRPGGGRGGEGGPEGGKPSKRPANQAD